MAIKYALYPNHLTDDPNDHMAVVQDQTTRTLEDIIDIMVRRGSTVTKADILSVFEDYREAVKEVLANGDSVITDLVRISPSIPGVFTDKLDSFDPARHHVSLNTNPGRMIGDIARELTVEKVEAVTPRPTPQAFRDVESATINETLTPGGAGELIGNRLKVDTGDDQQGVFLIASDGSETRIETLIRNKPSNLIFMLPDDLVSGEYEIEVRAAAKNSDTLRTGRLDAVLVAP